MLEREVERKLVKEVENIGGQALKFNSSINGMPDRIILLPGGYIYFIEVKAPGEKPRPLQKKRLEDLVKLGFAAYYLDSAESIDKFIKFVREYESREYEWLT